MTIPEDFKTRLKIAKSKIRKQSDEDDKKMTMNRKKILLKEIRKEYNQIKIAYRDNNKRPPFSPK